MKVDLLKVSVVYWASPRRCFWRIPQLKKEKKRYENDPQCISENSMGQKGEVICSALEKQCCTQNKDPGFPVLFVFPLQSLLVPWEPECKTFEAMLLQCSKYSFSATEHSSSSDNHGWRRLLWQQLRREAWAWAWWESSMGDSHASQDWEALVSSIKQYLLNVSSVPSSVFLPSRLLGGDKIYVYKLN